MHTAKHSGRPLFIKTVYSFKFVYLTTLKKKCLSWRFKFQIVLKFKCSVIPFIDQLDLKINFKTQKLNFLFSKFSFKFTKIVVFTADFEVFKYLTNDTGLSSLGLKYT